MALSGLGGTDAANVSSFLNQPADKYCNDQTVEIHWAIKAFEHANTYFKIISALEPKDLKLTKADDDIYEAFRKEFPDMNVKLIIEDTIKSEESKAKWRDFCNRFENRVEDWNMGTLLRLDADKDISDENTTLVPRIQFLSIEIARNREGYNSHHHKQKSEKDKEES